MKYFEGRPEGDRWGNKFNWIDKHDVFVGFDAEQS